MKLRMLKMFAPKFYFEMSILESQLALITSFVQRTTNWTQDRLIYNTDSKEPRIGNKEK